MSLYLSHYCTKENLSLEEAFQEKLCNEKEIKLKEFNFKIMHNILPCNYKLYKWKKIDNYNCDVCGIKQDIEHLLYDCEYVKPLWVLLENAFNVKLCYSVILCGMIDNSIVNRLTTLLAF